jgi:hypothetical protein
MEILTELEREALEDQMKDIEYKLTSYQDELQSMELLVKELDAAWNGDRAADNPDLVDLVAQIKKERSSQKTKIKGLLNILRAVDELSWVIKELENKGWTEMQDEQGVFDQVKKILKENT